MDFQPDRRQRRSAIHTNDPLAAVEALKEQHQAELQQALDQQRRELIGQFEQQLEELNAAHTETVLNLTEGHVQRVSKLEERLRVAENAANGMAAVGANGELDTRVAGLCAQLFDLAGQAEEEARRGNANKVQRSLSQLFAVIQRLNGLINETLPEERDRRPPDGYRNSSREFDQEFWGTFDEVARGRGGALPAQERMTWVTQLTDGTDDLRGAIRATNGRVDVGDVTLQPRRTPIRRLTAAESAAMQLAKSESITRAMEEQGIEMTREAVREELQRRLKERGQA